MTASESWDIRLTWAAENDLAALKGLSGRTSSRIAALQADPLLGHPLTGDLKGARALEFTIGGVAYRAVYVPIPEDRVCVVFLIGAHEGIYRIAQRRYVALRRQLPDR
jgi:hypothetical protein